MAEMQTPTITLTVRGEDPEAAIAPIFANFVGIAHQGTEVQFEFIFLDLNMLAGAADKIKQDPTGGGHAELKGRTVAKVIVPIANFVQLREHLNHLFSKFEDMTNAPVEEETSPEHKAAKGE